MEATSVQDLEATLNIAIAMGGIMLALLVLVAGLAWKLGRGLKARDDLIAENRAANEATAAALQAHDEECKQWRKDFRKEMAEEFKAGSRRFRNVERSLGRIEGHLGIIPPAEPAEAD